jgi:DNA polymerase
MWVQKDGIWMTALYHPSALLRDLTKRPETFADLLSIREKATQLSK